MLNNLTPTPLPREPNFLLDPTNTHFSSTFSLSLHSMQDDFPIFELVNEFPIFYMRYLIPRILLQVYAAERS